MVISPVVPTGSNGRGHLLPGVAGHGQVTDQHISIQMKLSRLIFVLTIYSFTVFSKHLDINSHNKYEDCTQMRYMST